MRRNPLDPYAFDTEEHPFIITGKATPRELHLGVHTATEYELAALYAVQRAMMSGTTAVVLHLNVQGLKPLLDRDVVLAAEQNADIGLLFVPELIEATDASDAEGVLEALEDILEYSEQEGSDRVGTWSESAAQQAESQHVHNALAALVDLDPDDALAAMKGLRDRGVLPKQVWMDAVGQQRYLSSIGMDRLVRVDLLRPINNELVDDEYPDDDPSVPQAFSEQSFYEDDWMPDVVTAWSRKAPKGAHIEFHGTDTTRAASAFPEIKSKLVSPWDYSQEAQPTMGSFSADIGQQLTEAQAARQVGVGIFPLAADTGRFLLGLRSWMVNSPEQWSGFGGALNYNEDPKDGAMRELMEETGYMGEASLYEFSPNLFIAEVPKEYCPKLNWETERARWCSPAQALKLKPKYWGLTKLLEEIER